MYIRFVMKAKGGIRTSGCVRLLGFKIKSQNYTLLGKIHLERKVIRSMNTWIVGSTPELSIHYTDVREIETRI